MAQYISKLHPEDTPSDTIYPDWIEDNSPEPVLYNYGTFPSGDVHTITKPGVYFLSSSNTYQNLPVVVESGVILSQSTDGNNFQNYLLLIDYTTSAMYESHRQGTNWTSWKRVVYQDDLPDAFQNFGVLPSGSNIFTYTAGKTGAWYLSSTYSYTNGPAGVFGGMLISYSDPASPGTRQYLQIFDANSNLVYYSHRYNNENTPWKVQSFGGVINKNSDTQYSISNAKVVTTLAKVVSAAINQNAWNITDIVKLDTSVLPTGTDVLGPIQELGQSDFSGGVHGHEVGTDLKIYLDGVEFSGTTAVFNRCDIYIESDIYRADENVKTFERHVHICFEKTTITFEVGYTAVNDVVVYRATNGGLYAETVNHISDIVTNVDGIVDVWGNYSTHWESNMVSQVFHLNRNNARVSVRNIYGHHLSTYKGALNVFSSESPVRYKTYMDIIAATNNGTAVSAGETVYGSWELIIE